MTHYDTEHQDGEGITPLHLACIQNRQNLAMILMTRWTITITFVSMMFIKMVTIKL